MASRKPTSRVPLVSGPHAKVVSTNAPFDDAPDSLVDGRNGYFPDPGGPSGFASRNGFARGFGGVSLYSGRGQGIYSHPALDGSTTSFIVGGGRMFQVNPSLTVATDVTPAGVAIDNGPSTRVSFNSLIGSLVVNDSVNPPWIPVDPTATPLVASYIDYDGTGVRWSALPGTLYGNAVFYPLLAVNGVSRRTDISWCNPGTPTIGWEQADFANNWTLETASAGPIFAIKGTNSALYYWRALSIGTATGTVNVNLASSATEDTIGFNVGTQAAQSLQEFGGSFFFCDAVGRPYLFIPGQPPVPIWHQMRAFVEAASIASPATTAINITSALEPTLNLYLVGIWSTATSTNVPPAEFYAFDAATGTYVGRWTIDDDGTGGINIECLGIITDSSGRSQLVALEQGGYVWVMNVLTSTFDALTTEDGVVLTTEDGVMLSTEYLPAIWKDDGSVPYITAKTGRMGYSEDTILNVDAVTVITLNSSPCRITMQTSTATNDVVGAPAPNPSDDGTYRTVAGADAMGRGVQVTVQPLEADEQWCLQRVTARVSVSSAGPEDA